MLDLERAVVDAVMVGEHAAGLVEHRMVVDPIDGHEMHRRGLHLGRQRPHVEVVDADHTGDGSQVVPQPGEVEVWRG